MSNDTTSPLRTVLERDKGTLQFGRALRLLGEFNPASLRDLIDELDAVRTRNALLDVLHKLIQECTVAWAKTNFLIFPDEDDLIHLTGDIEQHGAQTVAALLTILSAVRYPRAKNPETNTSRIDAATNLPEERLGLSADDL